jgi:hypothetical protein
MIFDIPQSPAWTAHLKRRFGEAQEEVGLLNSKTKPSVHLAKVFVPMEVGQLDVVGSDPSESLRELLKQPIPTSGWIRRNDVSQEAAEWLRATYEGNAYAELFCEAGLSAVGEPHLSKKPHIVHDGRPLLHTRIGGEEVEHIAQILRWGRGLRFLGVVSSGVESKDHFVPASGGLFICDVYDLDSFIVVPFQS